MSTNPTSNQPRIIFIEQAGRSGVVAAAQGAKLAHERLKGVAEQSPEYQKALNTYLQSTIRYMSIVTLLQARQHELLTEEVAELRAKVDATLTTRALH